MQARALLKSHEIAAEMVAVEVACASVPGKNVGGWIEHLAQVSVVERARNLKKSERRCAIWAANLFRPGWREPSVRVWTKAWCLCLGGAGEYFSRRALAPDIVLQHRRPC